MHWFYARDQMQNCALQCSEGQALTWGWDCPDIEVHPSLPTLHISTAVRRVQCALHNVQATYTFSLHCTVFNTHCTYKCDVQNAVCLEKSWIWDSRPGQTAPYIGLPSSSSAPAGCVRIILNMANFRFLRNKIYLKSKPSKILCLGCSLAVVGLLNTNFWYCTEQSHSKASI